MLAEQVQANVVEVLPMDAAPEETVRRAIESVLADPRAREALRHDHRQPGYISHPNVRYLAASVDQRLAGFFLVIDHSPIEVELHVVLLPWAAEWSRDLGRACLRHVFRDPDLQRATAQVVEGNHRALNLCRRLGFKHEGTRRNACSRGGLLSDVHMLGITREEVR